LKYIYIILSFSIVLFASLDNNITKEYQLVITAPKFLNKEDIAKELGVKSNNSLNFFNKKYILTQEFVDNIKPTLKGYLDSHGYFDAKFNIDKRGNIIYLSIKAGKPVRVENIKIDSNFKVKNLINFKKGDIFLSEKFDKIKDKIETKLLENGYCNAKIDTKAYIDLNRHSANLKYSIDKNYLCYFGDINITKKPYDIKSDVILSRIAYKKGEVFDIRKIQDSYNGLNALKTFANLQIKYDLDKKSKFVDTSIELDKKEKLRRFTLAFGLDSEIGLRVKSLWEKHNFLHNAKKLSYELSISRKVQKFKSKLFAPAFLNIKNRYFDIYSSIGLLRDKEDAYTQKSGFIKSYLLYNYHGFDLEYGLTLERLNIKLNKDYSAKIGGIFNILSPYLTIIYDKRDSKIDPKNGFLVKAHGEIGLNYRKNGVKYFKYLLEGRVIKSFNDLTLSAVCKFGAIHETNGKLPASKLFYGGGLFSNRAYGKDKIGAVLSNKSFTQLGGKSFVNLQLEANYKIHKRFYGAIFFDSTMISKQEYKFNGNRIDTLGFGIRYKTPIGPVKVDIGFNIHKRKDYAISIMLGQSF